MKSIKELNEFELVEYSAGASFAYRAGQAIRFMWINCTQSYWAATVDLSINETLNG